MKYLFINTVAGYGSTGRIAADQCRALMAQGHQCVIAYARKENRCPDVPVVQIGTQRDVLLHVAHSRILDNQGFGSKSATRTFLDWVRDYDPDVIWLHNVHGYYLHLGLLFDYLKTCGKEIHWTLHDCWAFTGHCIYFDHVGCDRWKEQCHHCPQKGLYPQSLLLDNSRANYRAKKALFTGIPNLMLRVPSYWLKKRVQESFLQEYPVEVVYNQIDTDVFKPTPSSFRQEHGLEGKKILLGVASVWEPRKGLKDFIELSQLLEEPYQIVLIGLTPKQIASLPEQILGLPRTNSAHELAQAYTAADFFLNPSTEETFGLTTLEAISCGTQAIVYQDTACEEIVGQFGGIAVPRGARQLLQAIQSQKEKPL